VLDLWVKGLVFDWNKLYGEERPKRMSLPTYPFARERYWVPVSVAPVPADHTEPSMEKATANFNEAFYLDLLDRVMDGSVSIEAAVQKIDS